MSAAAAPYSTPSREMLSRLVRAGLLTGVIDGLFSSVLSVAFYHSTVERLFQGVAGTLLGPEAFNGGTRTAIVGILMHFDVAVAWSAVFLFLVTRSQWIRGVLARPYGTIKIASLYGPVHMGGNVAGGRSTPAASRTDDHGPLVDPAARAHSIRWDTNRGNDRQNVSSPIR